MSDAITAAEFRARSAAPKKRSKYGNTKVEIDGITFASKAEGRYYAQLKALDKAGMVAEVELQKRFVLKGPKGGLITTYVADFAFYDNTTRCYRVVDVKGVETPAFKLKRKMMRELLGIEVEVVKA